jgi:hypothetical protein
MLRAGILTIVAACSEHGQTPPSDAPCVMIDAGAPPVVTYDWNDGSTQGWSASTGVLNVGNALELRNESNGSLQAFGPPENAAYEDTNVISFTMQFETYTTVASPSQLTRSDLRILTPAGNGELFYQLDVSELVFHRPHVFNLPVSTGVFNGTITRAEFLAGAKSMMLTISEPAQESNMAVAIMDDWIVGFTERCQP